MKRPTGRFLRKLRGLSHTWRWNYHPRVRQESVAEHSYWVAVIVAELLDMKCEDPIFRSRCIMAALYHDMEEAITGDLPSPVKRGRAWKDVELAAFNELTGEDATEVDVDPEVKRIVKMADIVSALLFADEEYMTGNRWFTQIRGELIQTAYDFNDLELNQLMAELGFFPQEGRFPIQEMSHL